VSVCSAPSISALIGELVVSGFNLSHQPVHVGVFVGEAHEVAQLSALAQMRRMNVVSVGTATRKLISFFVCLALA
jgi:hypothetical protein